MRPSPIAAFVMNCSLALVLTACGQGSRDDSATRSRLDPERIMLVVMGGNTSCGRDGNGQSSPFHMTMNAPFSNLRTQLEADGRFSLEYFISCHDADAPVHFSASDEPGRIFTTDFAGSQAKIDDLFDASGAKRLIVVGHSYGGWLAMKSAAVLHTPIDTLVTIDPISRPLCTVFTPAGCTQSPTDIAAAERQTIARNADRWVNYWQNKTFYLHASVIPEADENYKEDAQHTQIDSISSVWGRVMLAVTR